MFSINKLLLKVLTNELSCYPIVATWQWTYGISVAEIIAIILERYDN